MPLHHTERSELILYATPTGDLADVCAEWFELVSEHAPTAAQRYPPHCTLTGFFRRGPERAVEVVAETTALLAELGPVPDGAVEVSEVVSTDRWVGLELGSPWLLDVTARLVETHELTPGDDALRPKSRLHLSLAYGVDDLGFHHRLAETFHPGEATGWQVGIWERHADGSWELLTPA